MRVALVTDWFHPRVGGIEAHVLGLARRLRERGVDATVVTPWPGSREVEGVPVERIPLRLVPRLGVSLSPVGLARALAHALGSGRYDLVHAHVSFGSTAAIAAGWAGDRASVPVLGTFHSVFGPALGAVYVAAAPVLRWRRWAFRATAVSEAVAEDLRWIMPEREIEVLPCAVDPTEWTLPTGTYEPGRLRLVTTARLHPRKRLENLLRVLAEVRRRADGRADVTLEILGDGPQGARLRAVAQRLSLDGTARFLGPGGKEDVLALLARGDVFVNACEQESFGIAALEALSSGLPVVARAEGGVGSFVEDGRNGVLVTSDAAMASALAELATVPGRLAALRAGAAAGIPEAYTWSRLVDRHIELYRGMTVAHRLAADGTEPGPPSSPGPVDRMVRLVHLGASLLGPAAQRWFHRTVFDRIHRRRDPWSFEGSPYERRRMAAALAAAGPGPFRRCLEVGCSEGVFTGMLGQDERIGEVTALDISPRAVQAARERCEGMARVQVTCGDAGSSDLGEPFDLIFCMEILYYMGAARQRVASRLARALAEGGRIVLVHPAPEATALHRAFTAEPGLRLVARTVVADAVRPFEVMVLEALG